MNSDEPDEFDFDDFGDFGDKPKYLTDAEWENTKRKQPGMPNQVFYAICFVAASITFLIVTGLIYVFDPSLKFLTYCLIVSIFSMITLILWGIKNGHLP